MQKNHGNFTLLWTGINDKQKETNTKKIDQGNQQQKSRKEMTKRNYPKELQEHTFKQKIKKRSWENWDITKRNHAKESFTQHRKETLKEITERIQQKLLPRGIINHAKESRKLRAWKELCKKTHMEESAKIKEKTLKGIIIQKNHGNFHTHRNHPEKKKTHAQAIKKDITGRNHSQESYKIIIPLANYHQKSKKTNETSTQIRKQTLMTVNNRVHKDARSAPRCMCKVHKDVQSNSKRVSGKMSAHNHRDTETNTLILIGMVENFSKHLAWKYIPSS
jgi:hypothetical protein